MKITASVIVACLVCALAGCATAVPSRVDATFDRGDPASLSLDDRRWPVEDGLRVRKATFRQDEGEAKGETYDADSTVVDASFEERRRRRTLRYAWGTVRCDYRFADQRMTMRLTVRNRSVDTLHRIEMDLLALRGGSGLSGGGSHHNIGAPTVLTATWDDGVIAVCNEQIDTPLELSLSTAEGVIGARLAAGGDRMIYDEVFLHRPIEPGEADTYEISFRLGKPGVEPRDLAEDRYLAFREAHPPLLDWPDRRPINRLFFGGGLAQTKVNQWFKDPDSIELPTGATDEFREKRLGMVDRAIEAAKRIDAQGIIVWDIEGDAFPHATTYIGDPRLLHVFNPPMNAIADEMFKRIHDAGLLSGVTIRPPQITYVEADGKIAQRYSPVLEAFGDDPAFGQLNAKIEYCKQRWGTRIFYVDTPFVWRPREPDGRWEAGMIPADVWRRLMERHPDILIMPEFSYPECMAYVLRYSEYDGGFKGTPDRIERIYPDAWTCSVIEDENPYELFDLMVRNVRDGDSLMTFMYGLTSYAVAQKYIYTEAEYRDAGVPERVAGGDVRALIALLDSDDGRTRFFAAEALGDAGVSKDRAVEALVAAMQDEERDWLVRKAAALSLGRLVAVEAVEPLGALIGRKGHLDVFAARALASIGKPALPALMPKVAAGQRYAIDAVGRIGDPGAVPALAEQAEGNNREAKGAAIEALGRIGKDRATAVLIEVLNAEQTGLYQRCAVADALSATGRPEARTALERALAEARETDAPNHLKWCLGRALNRMK